tara:strand:+ start:2612 stop:4354 length:1743 start_codon:yes stop_codon:yes gene_type:complete
VEIVQSENQQPFDLEKLVSVISRRRKALLRTLFTCLIFTILVVLLYPASYRSTSTILIEQQEIPQDLVRSTVTSFADQRIEIISQRVMTSMNLWQIIDKYNLYKDERERETRESIINDMRNHAINRNLISADVVDPRSGRPTEATIAFQLSFEYENPIFAQKVANELTTLFLSENLRTRTQMAEQTSAFLNSEADKLKEKVNFYENSLAIFKKENFESLPELSDLNIRLLDRTEQALRENTLAKSSIREKIIFLKSELAQLEPNRALLSGQGVQMLSSVARLKYVKQELDQAVSRYSAQHPNVIRLQTELESLLNDVDDVEATQIKLDIYERQLETLMSKYSDIHPEVVILNTKIKKLKSINALNENEYINADNPAFLQIRAQLESTELELERLNKQEVLLDEDLKKYEKRISQVPSIEQTYQQLSRDYQSAVIKYNEVTAKKQEARLGETLESEQKGEKFTLIEPPLVPEEPSKPNRKLLFVLGIVASLLISCMVVILREKLDKSVWGRKSLTEILGEAPLATIPRIVTIDEYAKVKRQRIWIAVGLFTSFILALLLFHIFVKPLDVTWYVLIRKLGWM